MISGISLKMFMSSKIISKTPANSRDWNSEFEFLGTTKLFVRSGATDCLMRTVKGRLLIGLIVPKDCEAVETIGGWLVGGWAGFRSIKFDILATLAVTSRACMSNKKFGVKNLEFIPG